MRRMAPVDRRAHLVDAALRTFADRPEDEVGLEDLAAAAGVTRNLIYRYFDSRAELQRAAVAEGVRRVSERFAGDPAAPVQAKLPRNVAMWLDADDPAVRLLLRASHSADRVVARTVAAARRTLCAAIARNHLGEAEPAPEVLAVLDAYLTMGQQLIEAPELSRADAERVLVAALPVLVASLRPA